MTGQPEQAQLDKAQAFKALHDSGETFIIPNPWDAGSALMLQELGFKALATTSAGFARTLGRSDGQVTLEEKLDHCRALAAVTSIPISADFENGFADAPEAAAANVVNLAGTGLVGGSIEDWSGTQIYDFNLAVERIAAAAEAVANLSFPFLVTARAEGLFRGVGDLDEVIRRLQAYEAAGADVLYAPRLKTLDEVKAVVDAVSKPVNVLAVFMPEVPLADYAQLGVGRVSVGNALGSYASKAALAAATRMVDAGDFGWSLAAKDALRYPCFRHSHR